MSGVKEDLARRLVGVLKEQRLSAARSRLFRSTVLMRAIASTGVTYMEAWEEVKPIYEKHLSPAEVASLFWLSYDRRLVPLAMALAEKTEWEFVTCVAEAAGLEVEDLAAEGLKALCEEG